MSSSRALAIAAVLALSGRASAQEMTPPAPAKRPEVENLPPSPTLTEPGTPAVPQKETVAAPPPQTRVAQHPRHWLPLPALRLAFGIGRDVPSHPDQTEDFLLAVHAGVQTIRGGRYLAEGLLLAPEVGYTLRRAPLGDEHLFNIGFGIGYSYRGFINAVYMPYFVAGTGAYAAPLVEQRAVYGLRHGLLVGILYSLLTAELSHQVLAPSNGLPTLQDLRLLIGVDPSRCALGILALATSKTRFRR